MFELAERQLVELRAQRLQTSYPWQMRMRWQFIAARDGAMTIFHFGMTMEAIRSSVLRKCCTVSSLIEHQPLRVPFAGWTARRGAFEDQRPLCVVN
jgi:hypothetical protein